MTNRYHSGDGENEEMTFQSSSSSERMDSLEKQNNTSDERSDPKPLSISFCGSGFLCLYYMGVASCFRRHSIVDDKTIVCGASSGALAALSVCLDLPLGKFCYSDTPINTAIDKMFILFSRLEYIPVFRSCG